MRAKPSLRRRLSQHVLAPLVLTWAFGTAMVLSVAQHFAAQAFDRALLDDTYALAAHVRAGAADVSLTLTAEEMKMLLFDQSETIYFAVFRPDGSLAAGNPGLRPVPLAGTSDHEFADVVINRQSVRTVTLQPEGQPFTVVMGQTAHTRSVLLQQLLVWSALPQAMLLALLAWWLRRRIERDLQPLGQLEEAIGRRHAADLAPLPDEVKAGASTRDVERIAQAIDSMLARLAEGVRAQREFAGNVAHELRTPLAGIRAQATFALSQADPQVWRAQLEGIAQAEQRASRLVDQLLALARAREGRGGGVAREAIALDAIAREVLLRFMPRARSAGVDLGGEGLDEATVVQADRALVEGILNNLVDNALRYGAGHAEPRITVAIARAPGGIELSVTDNGEGWPSHDLERLTRRWEQGDPGRRAGEGAGLGLAIVTRYAELLGAQFSIGEAPGGGARATLLLAD